MNSKNTADKNKKKFPMGWLFLAFSVSLFLGQFWNYMPVVRGIVGLFVVSKFFVGMSGVHLLL